MAGKKRKSSDRPLKERAVLAALDLASRMGWEMVTMTDIADKARTSLAELCEVFDEKGDILAAYGKMVDRQVLEACADPDPSSPEKDRLFEIFMERFDILNKDREAVVSILKSFITDPGQAAIGLPHLGRSMAWMLEAAGIDVVGVRGAVKIIGLTAIYLNILRHWMNDDSPDLSKTMAALDRNLDRAQQCARLF